MFSHAFKLLFWLSLTAALTSSTEALADHPSNTKVLSAPPPSRAAAIFIAPSPPPSKANTLTEQGLRLENTNQYSQAVSTFRLALSILEKTPGVDPEEMVAPLNGLGRCLGKLQNYSEAERTLKRSVAIQRGSSIHCEDEMLAMTLDFLGEVLGKERKFTEAETVYRQSLTMREKTYGKNSYMVQNCLTRLSNLALAQNKGSESEAAKERIINIEEAKLGQPLGSFYVQQMKRNTTGECVLPLSSNYGTGARFEEKQFTKAVKVVLGHSSTEWCKIPDWLAGLWGQIPKNEKIQEINGVVWPGGQPPMGFYSGPGPCAHRRGYIRTKGGWWDQNQSCSSDMWDCAGGPGSPVLVYTYYRTLLPAVQPDGSIRFRRSELHFRVKPDNSKFKLEQSIFVPGTVKDVWQEDNEEVYKNFPGNKVACFVARRIYDWNGRKLDAAPGDPTRQVSAGVGWQNRVGPPGHTHEQGIDYLKSLKEFLTKQKMQSEIPLLEKRS